MVDDNVTPLDNQKQNVNKDPKLNALNKIKEAAAKEYSVKIDVQVKKTVDAKKIFNNEKRALIELLAEAEEAKAEYADLLKEI